MEVVKRVQFPERCNPDVARMQPNDFLGRDRSPSGPSPWYCPSRLPPLESDVCPSGPSLGYWIGRVALFVMPADMALSEKSPHLGGTRVTWIFRRPECSPMTS
jgi:hypothetical protein